MKKVVAIILILVNSFLCMFCLTGCSEPSGTFTYSSEYKEVFIEINFANEQIKWTGSKIVKRNGFYYREKGNVVYSGTISCYEKASDCKRYNINTGTILDDFYIVVKNDKTELYFYRDMYAKWYYYLQ